MWEESSFMWTSLTYQYWPDLHLDMNIAMIVYADGALQKKCEQVSTSDFFSSKYSKIYFREICFRDGRDYRQVVTSKLRCWAEAQHGFHGFL
jgi:hypothetical protein